jgi:hypothetical protein
METEKIPMGQKQLQRWHLIKLVEGRKMTLREAGEKIGYPTGMRRWEGAWVWKSEEKGIGGEDWDSLLFEPRDRDPDGRISKETGSKHFGYCNGNKEKKLRMAKNVKIVKYVPSLRFRKALQAYLP